MGRIGAWFGGSTTGMKALVALACVVVLVASGCSAERPSAPSDSHKEAKQHPRLRTGRSQKRHAREHDRSSEASA